MSTAVAPVDRKGITALLETKEARTRIEPMLRGVDYNRVMGEVYLACGENPEIIECTPTSIIRAVARAVSWGGEIGTDVHLVPFNVKVSKKGEDDRWEKRVKPIQDYKFKAELIVRCGGARSIDAQVVYADEPFEYTQGTAPAIMHKPARNTKDRGAMIGAYAIAHHGALRVPSIVYLTLDEIDAIRLKHSKQWKQGACPPWYARKTCVNQLAKLLPKSPKLALVMKVLEEDETEVGEQQLDPANEVQAPAELRAPRCICDPETGEQHEHCPIHGDFANEVQ